MLHAFAIAAVVLAAAQGEKTGRTFFPNNPVPSSFAASYQFVRAQPLTGVAVPAQAPGPGVAIHHKPAFKPGPCGMPTIAADASIDPKIIVPIPERVKRALKIRVIEPPPCGGTP